MNDLLSNFDKKMVQLELIESKHRLLDNIGSEDILTEFKQWFLKKTMTLDDIYDLKRGFINSKLKRYIYESVLNYIDKYYDRYLLSLTNIKKNFLPTLLDKTHSRFIIGVDDDGTITGIPVIPEDLHKLKNEIMESVLSHYTNVIGLHYKKGKSVVTINGHTYYDFEKLITILKKHTIINIHMLKKNRTPNQSCDDLLNLIENTLEEEEEYLKSVREIKSLKKLKKDYNERYSQGFHKLIRSSVMDEFREYTSIPNDMFDILLTNLKNKIVSHNDVEKFLKNGLYIPKSLFPNDSDNDKLFGNYMTQYLAEYKDFKKIKLNKNIEVPNISPKHPIKKINPLLKNIACFNEYLDLQYCMIEIRLPFIKDKNVYIAKKNNEMIKILERDYIKELDTPCTSS